MGERRWIDRTRERVTTNSTGAVAAIVLVVAVIAWMVYAITRSA